MDTGGVADQVFILKSLVAKGSARNLALFRLPLEPPAIKIRQAQFKISGLEALALQGKTIIQGHMVADVTYIDDAGHTRLVSREQPVQAMIPLPDASPELEIIPFSTVEESVVELISPGEGMVKATYQLRALATKDVIVRGDILCPVSRVVIVGHGFVSEEEEFITQDHFRPTLSRDVSDKSTFTYLVRNIGLSNTAEVQMEISPDNVVWQPQGKIHGLPPLTNATLTPLFFLRYVRLQFRSAEPGKPTIIHIWFQAQG